jgi:hypothetical protein
MKRLCAVLSLVIVLILLVAPTIARADESPPPTSDGWTWDEASVPAPDGWTWDE